MKISGTKFFHAINTFWQRFRVIKILSATKSFLGVKADVKCPRVRKVKGIFVLVYFVFHLWLYIQFLLLCLISIWLISLHLHFRVLSLVGLSLIALGTGGIKPCVAAFGGDQFEQKHVSPVIPVFSR